MSDPTPIRVLHSDGSGKTVRRKFTCEASRADMVNDKVYTTYRLTSTEDGLPSRLMIETVGTDAFVVGKKYYVTVSEIES